LRLLGDKLLHKQALKLVFSNPAYLIISGSIFTALFVLLLAAREFLFFEPYFVFQLPQEWIPSFILIIIISALIGLVTSMGIFQLRTLRANTKKMGTGFIGSLVGVGAGVCSSCGPVGFAVMSTFGVAGVSALSFLYDYEIPIRLAAIGILSATYFLMVKAISIECKIKEGTEQV
jgi:hypothetical protein